MGNSYPLNYGGYLAKEIARVYNVANLKDERPIAKAIVDGKVLPNPEHPTLNTVEAARERLRHIDAIIAGEEQREAERRERISSATLLTDEYWQYQDIRTTLTFIHGVLELIVDKTKQPGYGTQLNDLRPLLERCNTTDSRAELFTLKDRLVRGYESLAKDMQNIPDFAGMVATGIAEIMVRLNAGVATSEFTGDAAKNVATLDEHIGISKQQAKNRQAGLTRENARLREQLGEGK